MVTDGEIAMPSEELLTSVSQATQDLGLKVGPAWDRWAWGARCASPGSVFVGAGARAGGVPAHAAPAQASVCLGCGECRCMVSS